jgi:hypothetical protein
MLRRQVRQQTKANPANAESQSLGSSLSSFVKEDICAS